MKILWEIPDAEVRFVKRDGALVTEFQETEVKAISIEDIVFATGEQVIDAAWTPEYLRKNHITTATAKLVVVFDELAYIFFDRERFSRQVHLKFTKMINYKETDLQTTIHYYDPIVQEMGIEIECGNDLPIVVLSEIEINDIGRSDLDRGLVGMTNTAGWGFPTINTENQLRRYLERGMARISWWYRGDTAKVIDCERDGNKLKQLKFQPVCYTMEQCKRFAASYAVAITQREKLMKEIEGPFVD